MKNPGRFLRPALDSVLQQSHADLEVIVVDDGCTDGSEDLVQSLQDPRIRVIDGPRVGIAAALNVALEAVRGGLVMRCDADDLYPPGRIARQVAWMAQHPAHLAVCGWFSAIDANGNHVFDFERRDYESVLDIAPSLLSGDFSTHLCTFAARSQAARSIGGFRKFFKTAEDLDFMLRLCEGGQVGFIRHCAYLYRLHGQSTVHCQPSVERLFFERLAREFHAQRRTGGHDALQLGSPPVPPTGSTDAPYRASRHVSDLMIGRAWESWRNGQRIRALSLSWGALKAAPTSLSAMQSLLKMLALSAIGN